MEYSKKPVSLTKSNQRTAQQSGKRRPISSRTAQSHTRSLSSEEIRNIRNQDHYPSQSVLGSRSSARVSKNENAATRRKALQNSRAQSSEIIRNTHQAKDEGRNRSDFSESRSTERRTAQNAQRKAAIRNAEKNRSMENFRGPAMAPPKKRRRPLSKGTKAVIVSCFVVILCAVGYGWWLVTGNLNSDLNSASVLAAYQISDEAATMAKNHDIVNVAVFGVDGRDEPDVIGDRSDTMMIATADFESGGIKITSIMRDTFVWVEAENDYDKINAAYAFGGAEAAIQTINQNFDTPITDYVTINFDCMVQMVNAVGGVEVTIDDEELLDWTNDYLGTVNESCGTDSPRLTSTGTQTLDGSQALAYCRVRYTGNGDFDRTKRQRDVFKQVVLKALDLNPFAQYALLQSVLPYVKTSLSTNEIMKYALNVMLMKGKDFSQMQLPVTDYCDVGMYSGISYVFPYTLEDNIKAWYRFVYRRDYFLSDEAQEISDEIAYIW